ncbi:MAG: iron-containing alcohol dehydrogenase family protein [Clostridiales bacterium]|nr:iron-containing alcohol dehydrogenase family protein [Clostridiales bacterium]
MKENFAGYSLKNLINKRINCVCKEQHFINASLFYGDFFKNVKEILKKDIPFSKVVVITKTKSFEKFGNKLLEELKENGNIPLSLVLDNLDNSVEKISSLFCLPEDIRCVISFDIELIDALSYFAEIKNIPLIFIPTSLNLKGLFSNRVAIKVGEKEDKIKITAKKYLIIDEKIIETNFVEVYVNALSNLVGIVDLRVNDIIFSKKSCENALLMLKNSTFEIIKSLSKKRVVKLIEEQLKIEIVNNFLNDRLYNDGYHATIKAQKLLNKTEESYKFNTIFYLLELYRLYFSKKFDSILSIPDYEKRAEELSLITNEKEIVIIKRLKENLLNFFEFENKLKKYNAKLLKYINSILKGKKKFFAIFNKLIKAESVDLNVIKKSIYIAPDLTENYTTLSLIREKGILENIL